MNWAARSWLTIHRKGDTCPPADFARYRHVVTGACALFDAMLGRLLDLAGEGIGVLLISTPRFSHRQYPPGTGS